MICRRGLSSTEDSNIIPMASIGELLALLGSYTPVRKLSDKDIIFDKTTSKASVQNALLLPEDDKNLLDFPEGLAQNEDLLENKLSEQESNNSLDSVEKLDDSKQGKSNKNAGFTGGLSAAGAGLKNAGRTIGALSALLKRNNKNDLDNNSDSSTETDSTGTDYDFHDIAAAEMANILAPTELDADDSIFHNLSSTYTSFPSYSESKSSDALNNEEAEKYNNIENESDSKNDYSQKDNLASPLMPRRFHR